MPEPMQIGDDPTRVDVEKATQSRGDHSTDLVLRR